MLRSPVSSTGPGSPAITAVIACSWRTPDPGIQVRWVFTTASGPERGVQMRDHGGAGLLADPQPLTEQRDEQREARDAGPAAGISCQRCTGVAGEQGDAVLAGRSVSRRGHRPHRPRDAGQRRDEPVVPGAHRLGGDGGQVGVVGAGLRPVDLLQGQHVRIELHDRRAQQVEVDLPAASRHPWLATGDGPGRGGSADRPLHRLKVTSRTRRP